MRCYDGCPDTELKTLLDERERIRSIIRAAGYSVTYFPMGEFYMAFNADHIPATGEMESLHVVAQSLGRRI